MANSDVASGASQAGPSRLFGIKIIKSRFQFKFALIVFAFLAAATGCIWFWGNATVGRMIEVGMVSGEDAVASLIILRDNILYISILSLAIVFGLTLLLSHYIAGPIYRFERTLEAIRDGDLSINVKLRKKDEFQEVADLFNQALASLRKKVRKEREVVEAQADKLKALSAHLKAEGHIQEAIDAEHISVDLKNNPPQLKI